MRNDTAVPRPSDAARQRDLRARFEHFRGARRRSALGLPEVAALGVAALLLLGAILSYLFLLVPQRSRQQSLAMEREGLQRQLQSERTDMNTSRSTQENVQTILSSLERFEIENLGQSSSSTKTVYEELNRLILKNKLRISGGIQFVQLQEAVPGADDRQPQRRGGARQEGGARVVQSIFPGVGITLTVEGAYPNLRRFVRDIEADRQFVVINTVELEGVTDSNTGASVAAQTLPGDGTTPATPTPGVRGSTLVSLRLDMAAYFRRAATSGM